MIADRAYIVRIFGHCVQNNYSVYRGNKRKPSGFENMMQNNGLFSLSKLWQFTYKQFPSALVAPFIFFQILLQRMTFTWAKTTRQQTKLYNSDAKDKLNYALGIYKHQSWLHLSLSLCLSVCLSLPLPHAPTPLPVCKTSNACSLLCTPKRQNQTNKPTKATSTSGPD